MNTNTGATAQPFSQKEVELICRAMGFGVEYCDYDCSGWFWFCGEDRATGSDCFFDTESAAWQDAFLSITGEQALEWIRAQQQIFRFHGPCYGLLCRVAYSNGDCPCTDGCRINPPPLRRRERTMQANLTTKDERLEWQALIAGDPTRVKCLVSKDFFLRLLSDADRAELAALESTTGGISFKKKGA